MALINCPECGKQVSTAAKSCPNCGYPVAEHVPKTQTEPGAIPSADNAPVLAEIRPSGWGFVGHVFCFCLIVPAVVAAFRRSGTMLLNYRECIHPDRGML